MTQKLSPKASEANKVRDKAANRGTYVHNMVEDYLNNKPENELHETHSKKFLAYMMFKVLKDKLKGEKISLRMNSSGDKDKIIKVWSIPEFVDEMEDIETVIPDMKDKKEYEA